jgi:hypothetical protein
MKNPSANLSIKEPEFIYEPLPMSDQFVSVTTLSRFLLSLLNSIDAFGEELPVIV